MVRVEKRGDRETMINWKQLIVTDSDGDSWGELGDIVQDAPANLDNATIEDGQITSWDGFFISAPGEDPVDWEGFTEALNYEEEEEA